MTSIAFLAHFLDPFQLLPPVLWLISQDWEGGETTLAHLSTLRIPVVTYDTAHLIAAFRKEGIAPPSLIDIRDGLKILSGLSKDQGGERQWNIYSALSRASSSNQPKVIGDLISGKAPQRDPDATAELVRATGEALEIAWRDLRFALEMKGEWARFSEIEIPIQKIFREREFLGVPIDSDKLLETIEMVRFEKYTAFRELAKSLGFSPASLGFWNVGRFLKGTDAEFLLDFVESQSLEKYFELAQERSQFARAFLSFSNARKQESTLIKIRHLESGRTYPTFECFGTVTGRVMVTNPPLQTLKKRHRSLIKADSGKVLLYFDYCQFEPGVLAGLAGDQKFVELYNSRDVYESLALAIFGTAGMRNEAKQVFLGYMYGMSSTALARMLGGPTPSSEEIDRFRVAINDFFEEFPMLWEYRRSVQSELQEVGYVSSMLGNRRNRLGNGRLDSKEQQWALSQRVQGTASLIFKDAILKIEGVIGSENILLPMHDALLVQCMELEVEHNCARIETIMKSSFTRWCPKIEPRVSIAQFAS